LGVAAVRELRNPEYRARYYAWRMVKLNGTDSDRFRARMHLRNYMDGAPGSYGKLIGSLRNPALPVKTADEILALVLEMKDSAAQHGVDIRGQLAESMRTDNADIRERIQKLLLYMADRDHLEVPEPLKTWHSDPKNSSSDVDLLIRQWHSVKPATVAPDLASAVLKGVKPGPSRARAPIP
jgi:hypothetical protein